MGTIKHYLHETLNVISDFFQQTKGAHLLEAHHLTYQLSEDGSQCNRSSYLLIMESLVCRLKNIIAAMQSDDEEEVVVLPHRHSLDSDNESCSDPLENSGEGGRVCGSQSTSAVTVPSDTRLPLSKPSALAAMVDNTINTSAVTFISGSLPSAAVYESIPSSTSSLTLVAGQSTHATVLSATTLNADVTGSQAVCEAKIASDETQVKKCIKCGETAVRASTSAASSVQETCAQCSSIAKNVSKRRRQKADGDGDKVCSTAKSDSASKKTAEAPSKKHSCEKCGRVFAKWKHLSIHSTKVHLDEDGAEVSTPDVMSNNNTLPLYCCKTCNLACISLTRFSVHTCRLPTDDESCSPTLSNRILITNVLKLHKLRKFVCETCGVEYRTFKRISYHLPRCSPGPYPCIVCTHLFTTQKELNYHKKKMHKDEKCFVCEECGKSFQRRTSLQKHAITWHESSNAVGPFKCDLCPKKFIRRIYLTNHKLRMHGLDKKYLCQVCGNKFMTQNSLMAHMEVHSDVRRFECTFCKKKFKRKEKLKYHERIHTGERPFQCQICFHGFVSKTKLDEHLSRHRGDRRYRCSYCTKTYAGAWDLKQHIRKIHDKECEKIAVSVVANQQPNTSSSTIAEVQDLDPLAIATAASGLKEEEDITCSSSSLSQSQATTSSAALGEIGSGLVSGPQYITMGGQQAVAIPVVGSMQAHIPPLGHVVQVSGSSVPISGVGSAMGGGGGSVSAVQAVQALPGVATAEYSVQALPPHGLHTAQGYIFTQSFDMVSGTLQY